MPPRFRGARPALALTFRNWAAGDDRNAHEGPPAGGAARAVGIDGRGTVAEQVRKTDKKNGVDDGIRTHDHLDHNQGLCQLSYIHHHYCVLVGTPGRARTCDLRIRNPLLYPAELRARRMPGTGRMSRWQSPSPRADANNGLRAGPCQGIGSSWSGRRDSNSRPPAPKAGAPPDCATPRPSCRARARKPGPLSDRPSACGASGWRPEPRQEVDAPPPRVNGRRQPRAAVPARTSAAGDVRPGRRPCAPPAAAAAGRGPGG